MEAILNPVTVPAWYFVVTALLSGLAVYAIAMWQLLIHVPWRKGWWDWVIGAGVVAWAVFVLAGIVWKLG